MRTAQFMLLLTYLLKLFFFQQQQRVYDLVSDGHVFAAPCVVTAEVEGMTYRT